MKNLFLVISLFFVSYHVGASCSSPISRSNLSANTVLTSTKYNSDLNTVYSKVNNIPGDCIEDGTVSTTKIADDSVTTDKLAPGVLSGFIPAGTILPYAGTVAPTGFLLCNGTTVSRTTYADLFAVVGTSFGSGNGSTTFHLPDFRGRFLRGVDGGAGRDPNRLTRSVMNLGGNSGDNVGSIQDDAFQGHGIRSNGDDSSTSGSGSVGTKFASVGRLTTPAAFSIDSTTIVTDGVNGTPRTSSETRPLNAGVNFIIKI